MTRAQVLTLAAVALLGLAAISGILWVILAGGTDPFAQRTPPASQAAPEPAEPTSVRVDAETPTSQTGLELATQELPAPTAEPVVTATLEANPMACLPPGESVSGKVAAVLADGSLRVEVGKQTVDVRLLGVDPVGSGGQALGLLRELTGDSEVRLLRDTEDVDAAGLLLRYVTVGGVFVNYELVRRGAALPALYPPGQACADTMLAAEKLARDEGLGYWAQLPGENAQVEAAATATGLPCDCSREYQCSDFTLRRDAQACYNACGDYRNVSLDEDKDGLACEALP